MWLALALCVATKTIDAKAHLVAAATRAQSANARSAVVLALDQLLASADGQPPPAEPAAANGLWRMLWSSQTADVNPFATPANVLGGASFQKIEDGRILNEVRWAPGWKLVGRALAAPAGDARTRVTIDGVELELAGASFDLTLRPIARLIDSRKKGSSASGSSLGEGFLETLFLDHELRVSRDSTGFLYVFVRDEAQLANVMVNGPSVASQFESTSPFVRDEAQLANVMANGPSVASQFESTSPFVRSLVSGLTNVINTFANALPVDPLAEPVIPRDRSAVDPAALLHGVREDYEVREYLWTGDIDATLYDEDCVFTDPTLSFKGLDTFLRNVGNLRPILKRLVRDRTVELYELAQDEVDREVRASWRMAGTIELPWKPRIDLRGQTRFRYRAPEEGGRIFEYIETWELAAGEALAQLLRPGNKEI